MDQFLVLTTLTDRIEIDSTADMLETAGIPIMLEHVEVEQQGTAAPGVRVLVPSQWAQRAFSMLASQNQLTQ